MVDAGFEYYDVFLACSGPDRPAVEKLARRLKRDGLKPFPGIWNLIPGDDWPEALEGALAISTACAVFIGPGGFSLRQHALWAAIERRAARSRGRYLVILVLLPGASDVREEELPRFLLPMIPVDTILHEFIIRTLDDAEAYHTPVACILKFTGTLDDEEAYQKLVACIRDAHTYARLRHMCFLSSDGSYAWYSDTLARVRAADVRIEERDVSRLLMSTYYPKEVSPRAWYHFYAYIFRGSAAGAVEADVRERLGERFDAYRHRGEAARRAIAGGSGITATPRLEGFQFNPPSLTICLYERWHRLDFKLRARAEMAERASNGRLTFTVEGVIVADIPISIYVGEGLRGPVVEMVGVQGGPYQAVFCCYSRRDTRIVERVECACKSLGIDYLRDIITLRSGQRWQAELLALIERADIFQLFWSRNAARSEYVEQEWRHALGLGREPAGFIRPIYWAEPLFPPPAELGHLNFAFVPELSSRLGRCVSFVYRLVAQRGETRRA